MKNMLCSIILLAFCSCSQDAGKRTVLKEKSLIDDSTKHFNSVVYVLKKDDSRKFDSVKKYFYLNYFSVPCLSLNKKQRKNVAELDIILDFIDTFSTAKESGNRMYCFHIQDSNGDRYKFNAPKIKEGLDSFFCLGVNANSEVHYKSFDESIQHIEFEWLNYNNKNKYGIKTNEEVDSLKRPYRKTRIANEREIRKFIAGNPKTTSPKLKELFKN